MSKKLVPVRLKHIATVDFRKSDMTSYEALCAEKPALKKLHHNECVLFLAQSFNQMYFCYGFAMIEEKRVLTSRKVRCTNGAWSPLMLKNYAAEVGLDLVGFKSFEEHFLAERERKTTRIAEKRAERVVAVKEVVETDPPTKNTKTSGGFSF